MSVDIDPFDLDAAGVRRSQGDLRAFMEALAVRLEGALPSRVSVERRRDGLLASTRHVHEITFNGDGAQYRATFEKGQLTARKCKTVRGVVISNTNLPFPQWLDEVRAEVRSLAGALSAASETLDGFL